MPAPSPASTFARCVFLAFNPSNRLAVRRASRLLTLAFVGDDEAAATAALAACFPDHTLPVEYFTTTAPAGSARVFFSQVRGDSEDPTVEFLTLEQLGAAPDLLQPELAAAIAGVEPYLIEIP